MKYKTEFRLKKGFRIHIDGVPYEYLGGGMVGTNTDLESVYADTNIDRPDNTLTQPPYDQ